MYTIMLLRVSFPYIFYGMWSFIVQLGLYKGLNAENAASGGKLLCMGAFVVTMFIGP